MGSSRAEFMLVIFLAILFVGIIWLIVQTFREFLSPPLLLIIIGLTGIIIFYFYRRIAGE
ncbi:MAG: hypothetical protein FGF48_01420 [Candidatus Brockarchaeota archaeon]|nr:hypothetical protein [Candidatus Brockarchaeota archaeon]MBO3841064.1 hypothetical protein [Candidatus Brockarchaeota archaeon]